MSKISQNLSSLKGKKIPLQVTIKENELFLANLKNGVRGLGKCVLGVAAAEALSMAVREATLHDSSRAAANWDLSFDGSMRMTLQPSEYGETPVGQRGDQGANANAVWEYKKMVYGIEDQPSSYETFQKPRKGGVIWSEIGIGLPGNPRTVELFNPIMGDYVWRQDGQGRTYAYNAFGGGEPMLVGGMAGLPQMIGSGFVPWAIRELNLALRQSAGWGHKALEC